MYSLLQRLRSARHRLRYGVSESVRRSRGPYRETPARELSLTSEQSQRVAALRNRYQVRFEAQLTSATSTNNYEYLDILDRAWARWGRTVPLGGVLCDVGCASFWYAAALQAFFRPRDQVGVEIEGYRRFKNGRSRIDYAQGYLQELPKSRFMIADYRHCDLPADVITSWFPFVGPVAILAWRLPLSLLAPAELFARICHNLSADGVFVMVNHGEEEADIAMRYCNAAGLLRSFRSDEPGLLSGYRLRPAILSCWVRR